MTSPADMELVVEYARSGSEEAFSALVARHINLVYSVALRRVGDAHQAEEICQAVFLLLARKAGKLSPGTVLAGWLYETARLTTANYWRAEYRRRRREQEAHMQSRLEPSEAEPDAWAHIVPLLEQAMAQLTPPDRDAVVLRFFQAKSFHEVGASLGTSEDAAKMRVGRALEKLRKIFARRGVALSAAALGAALATNSVQAAPAGLAASVGAAALKGAAATTSKFILIKTTFKIMAWTKAKTAIVIGAGILLAGGGATLTVEHLLEQRSPAWQVRNLSTGLFDQVPHQVRILPSKFPNGLSSVSKDDKVLGLGYPVENMLLTAFRQRSPSRMISQSKLPEGKFDFIANLPQNSLEGLQRELQHKFGLSASLQTRETNVLRLTVKQPGAAGLRPASARGGSASSGPGEFSCVNQPISCLVWSLENVLNQPVIDETGLTEQYDIDLSWDKSAPGTPLADSLQQALLEELGLELTAAKQPVEMLVVESK